MPRASRFTPLTELDVVVFDTETTGLDVAAARLLEIGAVRLVRNELRHAETFHQLVHPGAPIPPASTAIHGIDDSRVRDAPRFADVVPDLLAFAGSSVLVGQSVGFDLAVLWHEWRRVGLAWHAPQFLDTKLLAAVLLPGEGELTLDDIALRLGIQIEARHTALADALATAEIFRRLVPLLGDAGIRTLGEASARSNAQNRIRNRQIQEGWYDASFLRARDGYESGAERDTLARLARVDSFPYRHRIADVLGPPPTLVSPSTRLGDAIRLLLDDGRGALIAGDPETRRIDGILTEREALAAVARDGASALETKLESVMSSPVETLPQDAFLYRALGRVRRLNLRHLAVDDGAGRLVGLLSEHDLLMDPTARANALGDRLAMARSPGELGAARAELPALIAELRADHVDAAQITDVIAFELRELIGQAAELTERRMEAEGMGRPPVPYALLSLAEAGRGECLLDSRPSLALVFEIGDPGGEADAWFAAFAERLEQILEQAGLDVASTEERPSRPEWRASWAAWGARSTLWANQTDVRAAAALLDARPVFGDVTLAKDLLAAGNAAAKDAGLAPRIARTVAGGALASEELDLDRSILAPFATAGRALAISLGTATRATAGRFAEAAALDPSQRAACDAIVEAHAAVLDLALARQMSDVKAGRAPGRIVELARLSAASRRDLDEASKRVAELPALLRSLGVFGDD